MRLFFGVWLIALPALAWNTNDWEFLDTIEQANFRAFRNTKIGPYQLTCSGIIYDTPSNSSTETSIAGIGFKLAAMCIGHYRGWIDYGEAYDETLRLLKTFGNELSADSNVFPRVNGWTYHFYNNDNGSVNNKDGLSLLDHTDRYPAVHGIRGHGNHGHPEISFRRILYQGLDLAAYPDLERRLWIRQLLQYWRAQQHQSR